MSPHQVAWQTRHGHGNTFVVVRAADLALRVYLGSDGVDLRMDGVDAVEALEIFVEPYDWARFWELTCPGSGI